MRASNRYTLIMKPTPLADQPCPIAKTLDIVGPWWSLLLIRCAFQGQSRFKEFQESLGIAKNTLSDRLKHLVDNDIFTKQNDPDGSRHQRYVLTEKGVALYPILISMTEWGNKWAVEDEQDSYKIIDTSDPSREARQCVVDQHGVEIKPENLGSVQGNSTMFANAKDILSVIGQ